jgi:hypothetical protein
MKHGNEILCNKKQGNNTTCIWNDANEEKIYHVSEMLCNANRECGITKVVSIWDFLNSIWYPISQPEKKSII